MLAGGAGTRFWPASRRARPKPFVPLVGQRTLLGDTLARLRLLAPAKRTTVVSAEELGAATRAALRAQPGTRLLLEPVARNTAAAIAWAAADALGRGVAGVIGVFPADHHIPDARAFARAVRIGARAAADGERLVLLGIEPSRPDTAYGYLRLARGTQPVVPVARFVEKPDLARARRFVADGSYLWNAGMVLARPERILAETRALSPEVWDGPRADAGADRRGPSRLAPRAGPRLSRRPPALVRLRRPRAEQARVRVARPFRLERPGQLGRARRAPPRAAPATGYTRP